MGRRQWISRQQSHRKEPDKMTDPRVTRHLNIAVNPAVVTDRAVAFQGGVTAQAQVHASMNSITNENMMAAFKTWAQIHTSVNCRVRTDRSPRTYPSLTRKARHRKPNRAMVSDYRFVPDFH